MINLPETQELIDDMIVTMRHLDGVGIAAPQVGRNIRIVIITDNGQPLALINPKVVKKSFSKAILEEGCLSVPGYYGPVKRYSQISIKAVGRNGQEINLTASDLTARIIQHEIDHIDGVLFIDRAKKVYSIEELSKL